MEEDILMTRNNMNKTANKNMGSLQDVHEK
jgi:hypothetical protein